jgi:hypothetical protein
MDPDTDQEAARRLFLKFPVESSAGTSDYPIQESVRSAGESPMSQQKPITERIFEFLQSSPEGDFEALVTRYPEFTWNELYLEVSRLHRHGLVQITRGVGIFTIKQTAGLP